MKETSRAVRQTVWPHVHEVPAVVGIMETESSTGGVGGQGAGGEVMFHRDTLPLPR